MRVTFKKRTDRQERHAEVVRSLGLNPLNELNLYLLGVGLKRAVEFELESRYTKETRRQIKRLGLASFYVTIQNLSMQNEVVFNDHVIVSRKAEIGRIWTSLLPWDFSERYHRAAGATYGYPKDAVEAFVHDPNLGSSYNAFLLNSSLSGVNLPEFLAYISFVPAKYRISGEAIKLDHESEALGRVYHEHTRQNNPAVAERVHGLFLDRIQAIAEGNELIAAKRS